MDNWHICCDITTSCYANKDVRLRVVPANSRKSYFVSSSGTRIKGTRSPTTWKLIPKQDDNPWEGFFLYDGNSYIAKNSQLTSDQANALPLIPFRVGDSEHGKFVLEAARSVTDKVEVLTLDTSDYSVVLKEFTSSSTTLYQQWIVDGSGLPFSCTIEKETLRAGLNLFGWSLTDAELDLLIYRLPHLDYDRLTSAAADSSTGSRDKRSTIVNTSVYIAGILGAIVGFYSGGPLLSVAGKSLFAAAVGGVIGLTIEIVKNRDVDQIVLTKALAAGQEAMQSYFSLTPSGGPYMNNQAWEDIGHLGSYSVIGEDGLPLAGCVLPPTTGNKIRTWLPNSNQIIGFPSDKTLYPPLNNQLGNRLVYLQLFVIIQNEVDGATNYQIRIHPKWMNVATDPNRKVHSQLSEGSRFWAMVEGAGSEHMKVYAAGELYILDDDGKPHAGTLIGLSAQTGHYFDKSDNFNTEVYTTTRNAFKALGYTNTIYVDRDLTDVLQGRKLLP